MIPDMNQQNPDKIKHRGDNETNIDALEKPIRHL